MEQHTKSKMGLWQGQLHKPFAQLPSSASMPTAKGMMRKWLMTVAVALANKDS